MAFRLRCRWGMSRLRRASPSAGGRRKPHLGKNPILRYPPNPDGPAAGVSGTRLSGDGIKLLSVMRAAPEPFTTASLAVGTSLPVKFIGDRLHQWMTLKGWLQKVGRGEYKRTGSFPVAAPETE